MRTTPTTTRTIARLALAAGAFAGFSLAATVAPASATDARPPAVQVELPPVQLPPVELPPVHLPPGGIDVPPVIDPGDPVDPPCIRGCEPPTTVPCDSVDSPVICPEGDDPGVPDPGHPDPQTPPVVKVDPPVVAHPTFTG